MKRWSVEIWLQRLPTATILRTCRESEDLRVHQRVMEHDVGALQNARGAQREEIGRAGAGADQIDLAHQSISPAATVWLVTSSIRMKAPVVRFAS